LDHEIIFVDDGSTDGTREWLKTVGPALVAGPVSALNPGLRASGSPTTRFLLNERNLGFAGACNRGASAAQGELLFFLNNDLVFLPRWFEPMLAAFGRFPRAGLVGNVQVNFITGAADHTRIVFNCKGKPEHDTARGPGLPFYRRVPALTGACFGIRRATWQKLGGFDEGFVNGCEDVDLCFRAAHHGLVNYVARHSVVRHHVSASAGRKLRDEQNTARLVQRWRHAIARLAARDWCRHYLSLHEEEPRDYPDPALARDCFLYRGRLLPRPTARILLGVHLAIEAELERWEKLAG